MNPGAGYGVLGGTSKARQFCAKAATHGGGKTERLIEKGGNGCIATEDFLNDPPPPPSGGTRGRRPWPLLATPPPTPLPRLRVWICNLDTPRRPKVRHNPGWGHNPRDVNCSVGLGYGRVLGLRVHTLSLREWGWGGFTLAEGGVRRPRTPLAEPTASSSWCDYVTVYKIFFLFL